MFRSNKTSKIINKFFKRKKMKKIQNKLKVLMLEIYKRLNKVILEITKNYFNNYRMLN